MADRHIAGGRAFWGSGVVCLPSIQEALGIISSADASDWWGVPIVPAFPLEAKGGGSSMAARGAWKSGEDEYELGVGLSLTREKQREAKHYSLSILEFPRYFLILTSYKENTSLLCVRS